MMFLKISEFYSVMGNGSRVHSGFKRNVDNIWSIILGDISKKDNSNKNLWLTGHSLEAAMCTIMASRCLENQNVLEVKEIYSYYSSPRVGWHGFVQKCNIPHFRWRNNNDIVTNMPSVFMGYIHHGKESYLNRHGNYETLSLWNKLLDRIYGIISVKNCRIDPVEDHLKIIILVTT
jgi:predicted lipase